MTDTPSSLYAAWFNALPQVFRALLPAGGAFAQAPEPAADACAANGSMPYPADQVGKALKLLDGLLTQLYQGYLPLLAQGGLSAEPLKALASAGTDACNRLLAGLASPALALPDWTAMAPALQPWTALLQGQASGTSQLQLGIERTFGGLGEAFGLGPLRELEQAWRDMLVAGAAKQRAQAEYLALVAQAFGKGTQGLLQELQAMGERGERIESLLGFIRLWAKSVDAPLHDAMQDARGLEVTARVIRASTQHRRQLQKAVGLASEALQVPTRADMDLAYREIQELKRELRRLKKALPPAAQKKLLQAQEQDA